MMAADNVTERAAQVILNNGARAIRDGSAWTSPQDDEQIMEDCRDIAQALADAGLLVTPEHNAEVAAKTLREAHVVFGETLPHGANLYVALLDRADRIEREAGESGADA